MGRTRLLARIASPDRAETRETTLAQGGPVALMHHAHATKLAVCDRLEAIADGLPSNVSRHECESVARSIGPLLESAHRFEEDSVFPLCEALSGHSLAVAGALERLRAEHREDASYGEEVAEALLQFVSGQGGLGAETLGFMLRGFFGALRRHIAFERDYVGMIADEQGR